MIRGFPRLSLGRTVSALLIAGMFVLGALAGAGWALPGQDPQGQTVPTRTATASPLTDTVEPSPSVTPMSGPLTSTQVAPTTPSSADSPASPQETAVPTSTGLPSLSTTPATAQPVTPSTPVAEVEGAPGSPSSSAGALQTGESLPTGRPLATEEGGPAATQASTPSGSPPARPTAAPLPVYKVGGGLDLYWLAIPGLLALLLVVAAFVLRRLRGKSTYD